jgi:tight adherence protein B
MQMALLTIGILFILGLLAYVFAGPSAARSSARRINMIRARHSDSADIKVEQQMKKAVASRKPLLVSGMTEMSRMDRLRLRLQQSGKSWTAKQYFSVSAGLAIVVVGLMLVRGFPPLLAAFIGFLAGAGLPHFVLNFLIGKRVKNFTSNFPDAIDLLVRGLRSGLPVSETMGVVAKEIPGPVGEEFKLVTEKIKIGKSMEDALQDTADRLGTPEFQFFVITLAIQRETGGNLSETLSNLSDVLRKRAQMKLKIRSMSSESKASAYIVGSLPFFVFGMVWFVNPNYLACFFYDPRLIVAGLIGAVWMSIGAFIMAKMVSFEI